MEKSYKLISVTITNYKGIASQAFAVGPGGAILQGPNGAGKTSARDAVIAALSARGVDASCIRDGADSSEILIDLDVVNVRRRITDKGQTATVTSPEGNKWFKPQSRLDEIFGPMLDPLKFFLADKKEQRRLLLEACPVNPPTSADVAKWLGKLSVEELPDLEGLSGLEAVERLRKFFYDRRTTANAAEKAKAAAVSEARKKLEAVSNPAHSGVAVPPLNHEDVPVVEAKTARAALDVRAGQLAEQERRTTGTRERIAKLRADAEGAAAHAGEPPTEAELFVAEDQVVSLRAELAKAEKLLAEIVARGKHYTDAIALAGAYTKQAADLEASLTAVAIEPVTAEEIAKADQAIADAERDAALIKGAREEQAARTALTAALEEQSHAMTLANALEKAVTNLTKVAPKELMERSGGIPGIALTDDGITLDGRNIANLCGKERLELAIDIAKRASTGGGKLLCVDGLEAIDEENRAKFIQLATADGWQLLGTLVSGGELSIIELE